MNIIFCLPAKTFSVNWFNSWNLTTSELIKNQISYAYSVQYDPVVYYCRNRILGGNNLNGKAQIPWQGQIKYDYQIWIDSDIIWQPSDIMKLLSKGKNIVAGLYHMSDGVNYPVVETLDFQHLKDYGTFKFLTDEDLKSKSTTPFKVSYTGFGFIAIKYGVMESLGYPWFHPRWISNETFHDFCAEDVGFCWSAQEKGWDIYVDPTCIVKHEKTVLL
jgi:GT2 family glycosyltransferase